MDFVAFNLRDLAEQFDQFRTRTNQLKILLAEGNVRFSKDNNAMLTTSTRDLQKGLCSRKRHEMAFRGRLHGQAGRRQQHDLLDAGGHLAARLLGEPEASPTAAGHRLLAHAQWVQLFSEHAH